jgi:hypothetical protein
LELLGRGEKEKEGEKPFGSGEKGLLLNCDDEEGRAGGGWMGVSGGKPFVSWDCTELLSVARRFRGGIGSLKE